MLRQPLKQIHWILSLALIAPALAVNALA